MKTKSGSYGIVSLTCGIMGTIFLPFVFGTIAIIFGAVGYAKKQRYSLAGLILGIICWVYSIIVFFWVVAQISALFGGL